MGSTLFNQRETPYGLCCVSLKPRSSDPKQMTPVVYMYKCTSRHGAYTLCTDDECNLIVDWEHPIARCNWKKNGEIKVLDRDAWYSILSGEVRETIANDIRQFYCEAIANKS